METQLLDSPLQQREKLVMAWLEAKDAADAVKEIIANELEKRKELFAFLYQAPKEGVNKLELGEGYSIKGTYKLDRKVDEAVLQTVMEELATTGANPDALIEWKPALKTAVYRELTVEQIAIMDKALIIKPSTPTLEFVEPKTKKG
jgi:hypothetical protein